MDLCLADSRARCLVTTMSCCSLTPAVGWMLWPFLHLFLCTCFFQEFAQAGGGERSSQWSGRLGFSSFHQKHKPSSGRKEGRGPFCRMHWVDWPAVTMPGIPTWPCLTKFLGNGLESLWLHQQSVCRDLYSQLLREKSKTKQNNNKN